MADDSHARPLVVGLGGSASASSVTNHLLTVLPRAGRGGRACHDACSPATSWRAADLHPGR